MLLHLLRIICAEMTMGGAAWGLGNRRAGEEGSTHVLPESSLHTPAQGSPRGPPCALS